MDRVNGGWRRCLHRAAAGVWVPAILAAGTVAGCGSVHRRAALHGPPLGPRQGLPTGVAAAILPGAWLRSRAPARSQAPARPKPHATWLINPDEPLPANTPWSSVLAVARRFAVADMGYEVDEVGPAVRAAITHTCTGVLAAELFSHRAILPPGTPASQVRQELVAVTPLERLPHEAVVLATVRSACRGGPNGALELRLVPRPGGWRVARIRAV